MISYSVVLFAYNRPEHTKRVLESITQNHARELYIFHDGYKEGTDIRPWNETRQLLEQYDGADIVHRIYSSQNQGLAKALQGGITYVMERCEAAVILEDDCCMREDALSFFAQCFERYEPDKRVMGVSGYAPGIDRPADYPYDVYYSCRTSSWGWGTWKDRWLAYQPDYDVLKKIYGDPAACERLKNYGADLPQMLHNHIDGKVNSWALFWSLHVILQGGFCVEPMENLIENIGFDGTGVHCGMATHYQIPLSSRPVGRVRFPPEVAEQEWVARAMRKYHAFTSREDKAIYYRGILESWLERKQTEPALLTRLLREKGVKTVSVWGMGKMGELLIRELERDFTIVEIAASRPVRDTFMGYPVRDAAHLTSADCLIIIPGYDKDNIISEGLKAKFRMVTDLRGLL